MENKIELVEYNDFWLKVFEKESQTLAKLLRNNLMGCEHIGSTAMPKVVARPTLDILCVVHTLDGIEMFRNEFKDQGFSLTSNDSKHFLFERKSPEGDRVLTSVRILKKGDIKISDILDFRDYLNAEPMIATEYKNAKLNLIQNHSNDIALYEEMKARFIEAVLSKIS
ncbi:GrpB family protein [Halobacteriovorax sp. CON-3]|uniref:GrpB family protein n=1 Tax=Halobacteriovorax sp. CON-3 TaxID=3157710 RepID=UPI00371E1222